MRANHRNSLFDSTLELRFLKNYNSNAKVIALQLNEKKKNDSVVQTNFRPKIEKEKSLKFPKTTKEFKLSCDELSTGR